MRWGGLLLVILLLVMYAVPCEAEAGETLQQQINAIPSGGTICIEGPSV